MEKELTMLKERLLDNIRDSNKKGDTTLDELKCLSEAVDMLKDLAELDAMDRYGQSQSTVSGYYSPVPVNMSNIHHPNDIRSGTYPSTYRDGVSAGYNMRSGHSINDRIIARLESMYDTEKSPHDREVIDKWIRMGTANNM